MTERPPPFDAVELNAAHAAYQHLARVFTERGGVGTHVMLTLAALSIATEAVMRAGSPTPSSAQVDEVLDEVRAAARLIAMDLL